MKSKFNIKGLDCANCASNLEIAIKKIDGVENVVVNFITQKMEIDYDEERKEIIMQAMKKVIKKEEPDVKIEQL